MSQDILLTPQLDTRKPPGSPVWHSAWTDSWTIRLAGRSLCRRLALATAWHRALGRRILASGRRAPALEAAREAERPLRLIVQGESAQHLPWELLYHRMLILALWPSSPGVW